VDRILVIEDDRPSVDLLTAYLESAGFEVSIAHDGPIGVASIRRDKPAAVILDVLLPGMDGWEVLRTIKANPEIADLPVIVVSVLAEHAKGLSLGAAGYLVKPTSRDEVLAALASSGIMAPANAAARPPRLEHW
jgi:DNA-binding response OmpR family regulator